MDHHQYEKLQAEVAKLLKQLKQEFLLQTKAQNATHLAQKNEKATKLLLKEAEVELGKDEFEGSAKEVQRRLHNAVTDAAVAQIAIQRAKAGLWDADMKKEAAKKA